MMDYVHAILLPYIQKKRKEYNLSATHSALVIFDQFKGQLTETFRKFLDLKNVLVVEVPPHCTDRLQPIDLSVNKAIKDCLRSKFQLWYAMNVSQQLKEKTVVKPADLRLSVMKPLGAKWLMEAVSELESRKELIINGFSNAGILDAVADLLH